MSRNRNDQRSRVPGRSPSEKQNKKFDNTSGINYPVPAKRTLALPRSEKRFDMVVDGVPYSVKATPETFNDEVRFRVRINDQEEHLFAWDHQASVLRPIDDDAATLPSGLEEAVSNKLRKDAQH
jgi:hypothetical protein